MPNYFYDQNNVRYELVSNTIGQPVNWLFFPGGPGGDSTYLKSLTSLLHLQGNVWLLDFPGNGTNINNMPPNYNYDEWMDIFLPTIQKFSNPILVGHSFGGMFPLLFPDLEHLLKGFVILHSCPTLWLEEAVNYSRQFQVPDLTQEMCDFTSNPSNETFQKAVEACMPYYFPPESIEKGRELWKDVTIQYLPAVWWQKKAIEIKLDAKWIPEKVPTLVLGGKYDCITPFTLFQRDQRFHRPNIELVNIEKGGHCSWIEDPDSVISAFNRFSSRL